MKKLNTTHHTIQLWSCELRESCAPEARVSTVNTATTPARAVSDGKWTARPPSSSRARMGQGTYGRSTRISTSTATTSTRRLPCTSAPATDITNSGYYYVEVKIGSDDVLTFTRDGAASIVLDCPNEASGPVLSETMDDRCAGEYGIVFKPL